MLEHRRLHAGRAIGASLLVLGLLCTGAASVAGDSDGDAVDAGDRTGGPSPSAGVPTLVGATDEGVRVRRKAGVAISAPGHVAHGAKVRVTGRVKVAKGTAFRPREVGLEERLDGLWVEVRHTRTDRYGHFAVKAKGTAGPLVRTFRVSAGSGGVGLRPATSAPFAVQVGAGSGGSGGSGVDEPGPMEVPAGDWDPAEYPAPGLPSPAGNPADWRWLWAAGARWNPCRVITWAYNAAGGYGGSLADAQRAFAKVAGRSGLHFKYVGATGYVHGGGTGAYPDGVDVVVGWSDAAGLAALAGGVVGIGGGWAYPVSGADVANEIVSGYVVLDRAELLNGGFSIGGMPTWGQVLEHEIGHVVGLGHAGGAEQVMYAAAGSGNHLFGAGDLTGLTRVGATSGCL